MQSIKCTLSNTLTSVSFKIAVTVVCSAYRGCKPNFPWWENKAETELKTETCSGEVYSQHLPDI